MDLGLGWINAAGGVNGRPIELIYTDSKSDPKESAAVAQKYVSDKRIVATMGDFTSTACMAAQPIYDRGGLVQLSPTASHPKFAPGSVWSFGIIGTQAGEGPFMANYAVKILGKKKIGVLYINNDWGIATKDYFVNAAKEMGAEILAIEAFFETDKDFTGVLTKLRGYKPELLYIPSMYNEMALIAKQREKLGWMDVLISGPGSLYSPKLLENRRIGLALALDLWGIQKNLPYVPEVDEKTYFVGIPVGMAGRGSLNPGWFGHPGSTLFYPLAGIYRLLYGAQARQAFESNPLPFYYLGRGLSIVYAVLSLPFTFLVGRRVFEERVGVVGLALFALYPLAVTHAQVARTDSAAVFWGMVSLWRIFELRQAPSLKNQLMAGAVIGLSISSRFFMLTLVPLLLVVDVLLISQASTRDKNAWLGAGAGLLTVTMAFVLTSPYLFLDINTALVSLRAESRSVHLGADGLTRPGNLLWYLAEAIPKALAWPQYALALAGLVIVFIRRETAQLLLVGYLGIFLALISLAALHWAHCLIPVLPILALLAAFGLETLVRSAFQAPAAQTGALIIGTLVIAAHPAYQVIVHNIRESRPSTRVQAREWALASAPFIATVVDVLGALTYFQVARLVLSWTT